MTKVLVAGIGNIFLCDDGFGSEVAQRLLTRPQAQGVKVEDFGIRGVHLAYELLDGYDALVLVDAMPMKEAPGTVCLFEPDAPEPANAGDDVAPTLDAHSMSPGVVLSMLAVVVGCETASVDDGIGLSEPVMGAVDGAVEAVETVVAEIIHSEAREAKT